MPPIPPPQPAIRNPQDEMRARRSDRASVDPQRPFSILNLEDFIETVDTAPTGIPKNFYGSIKLVVDSFTTPTTRHLYIYSREINAWVKFTGAAA